MLRVTRTELTLEETVRMLGQQTGEDLFIPSERVVVLWEGGGHNSLGGTKSIIRRVIPPEADLGSVSIPMASDQSYSWWKRGRIIKVDGEVEVEWLHERWGEWNPNYERIVRVKYKVDGDKLVMEEVSLIEVERM